MTLQPISLSFYLAHGEAVHTLSSCLWQGFGVILERMTMSEEAALTAFDKVLKESQYIESARRVSRQLHLPRARTPLQEAGGSHSSRCTAWEKFTALQFSLLHKHRHRINAMCHMCTLAGIGINACMLLAYDQGGGPSGLDTALWIAGELSAH